MTYLWGRPKDLLEISEYQFFYRGVRFALYRNGRMWGCHGFPPIPTFQQIERDRRSGFPGEWPPLTSIQRADGWLHFRKNATLRSVCRSIADHARHVKQRDREYFDKKAVES